MSTQLPSGRHGLSREAVESNQRRRLLDAVMLVVGRRGYGATRVIDITKQAGVSRKTFYQLFSDREDCFFAAYDEAAAALQARLDAAEGDDPTRARLAALLHFVAEQPNAATVLMVEVLDVGRAGLDRRDAALAAWLPFGAFAVGGVLEVIYAAIRNRRTAALPREVDALAALVERAAAGQAPAAARSS